MAVTSYQDVARLQIAVDDPTNVPGVDAPAHVHHQAQRSFQAELVTTDVLRDRDGIRDVLHHEVRQLRGGLVRAHAMDLGDGRMTQRAEHACFLPEAKPRLGRGQRITQHLDGDRPSRRILPPLVHDAHAATAQGAAEGAVAQHQADQCVGCVVSPEVSGLVARRRRARHHRARAR